MHQDPADIIRILEGASLTFVLICMLKLIKQINKEREIIKSKLEEVENTLGILNGRKLN
jgi:hypothetical protein